MFRSVNPATETVVAEYPAMSEPEVARALDRAQEAFSINSRQPIAWRSERMLELAQRLRQEHDLLAEQISSEMGKPIAEAQAEVEKCAISCQYFAHQAEEFLRDQPAPSDSPRSFVAFRPLGVVLAIMPWNYPLWQVVRFLAPAL
ncbi:MAG: aldehyde dehydrogenase family protein, partial [Candidatus Dormibacteria bacterium]